MSEVERYHFVSTGSYYKHRQFVLASYYDALATEAQALRKQVKALQSAANSWQSGYDEGRRMGTKHRQSEVEQLSQEVSALREKMVPELLREIYEWGYVGGQNNPNGYIDEQDRDHCINDLLRRLYEQ